MCFIDSKKADPSELVVELPDAVTDPHQRLRADVEEKILPTQSFPVDHLVRLGGAEEAGRDALLVELLTLVSHQRDQRADDNARLPADRRRQLIANALARSFH
eukprot:436253-Hanusia_phi.AAC.1